jgi:hypothetical protein
MRSKKLTIITVTLLASCVAEDPAPVIAAIDYRLFCDSESDCAGLESKPARVVERGIDGQDKFRVQCLKGDKSVDLSLDFSGIDDSGTNYGLFVDSSARGTSPECSVRVTEGNNVYEKSCEINRGGEADCSHAAATDFGGDIKDMPCQVSVTIDESTVTGTVCCRNISEELKQVQGNEHSLVSSQGSSKPASFEFKNCR